MPTKIPQDFNKSHPERRSDEVFLANVPDEDWARLPWETKRIGKTAFDFDGNRISNVRPVFVAKKEVGRESLQLLSELEPQS